MTFTTARSAEETDIMAAGVMPVMETEPATTEEETELDSTVEKTVSVGKTYILNTNTKKFHYPSCRSVKQMKDKNKREFTGTRDEVISMGYNPCGNCHP